MSKVVDYSLGNGIFPGDLRYGRKNGNVTEKHKDFAAEYRNGQPKNLPCAPLVLVQRRDPEVWTSERKLVKKAKKKVAAFQHAVNYWIESYLQNQKNCNFRLTISKQKFS